MSATDGGNHERECAVRWFGASWEAPICETGEHVETPLGLPCVRCGEALEATDRGVLLPYFGEPAALSFGAYHHMCFFAMVMPVIVHRIRFGYAVCGFTSDFPDKWPPLHYWTEHEKQVTCDGCRRR